jgi:hypothetical protein
MALKFSFPEIPYRSTITSSLTMSTINHAQNTVKGDRAQYFAGSSASTLGWIYYVLGSGETCDHVIFSRYDIPQSRSIDSIRLYYYSGSLGLIKSVVVADAYSDLRSQDKIATFATTSSYTDYRVYFTGTSQIMTLSKIHFGLFFTLDQNPIEWTPKVDTDTTKPFTTDSGREYLKQTDYPRRTWFAKWTGITNAKCEAFYNKCAPFLVDDRKIGLFLYDDSGLNEFFGASLQHVWMYDINIERAYNDYNTITCTFMEQIG